MKSPFGIALLSAACIGLAGCMTANNEAKNARANKEILNFAKASSSSLAKTTATGVGGSGQVDIAAAMRSAGVCEKFVGMVEDLNDCGQGGCNDGLPQSVLDFVSCFGIKINGNGSIEDIDTISAALTNFTQFQNCVCGGSGTLFGNFDALKWQTFTASASAAAGASFDASKSNAAGSVFDASSSAAAGSAFDASKSNAAGQPYSAD